MIKKIRVWKVLLLTVVTFTIYNIFWTVQRRNEIVASTKLKIPHWRLYVLPILGMGLLFSIDRAVLPADPAAPLEGFQLTYSIISSIVYLALIVICAWWIWQFAKAYHKLVNGRVAKGWVFVYWLFLDLFFAPVLQYYLNRLPKTPDVSSKKKHKTSKKFIAWSITALVASLIAAVVLILTLFPLNYDNNGNYVPDGVDVSEMNAKGEKANNLLVKYNECIEELDAKYPEDQELTEADLDDYNTLYDKCEDIRLEQNKAADEYNSMAESYLE